MMQSAGADFNFFNPDGSIKDLRQITGILESEFGKIRAKYGDRGVMDISNAIFGSEGGRIADILIQSGVKGFDAMLAKMDAQASLQDRIQVKTGTLSAALEALGGAAENTASVFGSVFAADIQQFASKAQAFVENTLQPWLKENKELIKWVVGLVVGFFAAKLAMLGLVYGASMALMPIRALTTGLFKAQAAFRLFQLMRLGKLTKGVMMLRMFGLSAKNAASAARFLASAWRLGGSVLGFITRGILGLGNAFIRLGVMLLTNPVFLAFALLGTAAYLLYRNWGEVVAGGKALWTDFWGFIGRVADAIAGFFRSCWEQIKAFFSSGIGNIAAQILNWSPLGLFYQAFRGVLSWFGIELPAKFTGFGQMLLDGLIKGIQEKTATVVGVVRNVVQSIKLAVTGTKGMDVHSPSRVFKRYGGWIMEGLQIGLNRGAASPVAAVVGTAGRLKSGFTDRMGQLRSEISARVSAGADVFAAARASHAPGGITVHFNPTINAPGGNPQQLQTAMQLSYREFETLFHKLMDDRARRAY